MPLLTSDSPQLTENALTQKLLPNSPPLNSIHSKENPKRDVKRMNFKLPFFKILIKELSKKFSKLIKYNPLLLNYPSGMYTMTHKINSIY